MWRLTVDTAGVWRATLLPTTTYQFSATMPRRPLERFFGQIAAFLGKMRIRHLGRRPQ